ncbi:bacteriohemerythrin [Desulfovibrio ferrophilus]|uniref:Methyl-accepting chemotaxis sensory transducer n=1 Tax=Desulfovibrio ferrophilus TaxID=241368 RepID=A0A2Z6AXU8_9BACT|nr:bacteriohemerythrin [Desulfovibrio ferrophilus]BBD08061.1 methyl-accepting chemotaxis sensory transducer [Desulfovibrio ferrophilus]
MKLSTRITASVIIIFLITVTMSGLTWYVSSAQKHDSQVLNLAGRQRMLSQKLTKEVLFYVNQSQSGKPTAEIVTQITRTSILFRVTLDALSKSGKAPTTLNPNGPKAYIPVPSEGVKTQLDAVRNKWNDLHNDVGNTINSNDAKAIQQLIPDSVELLKEMNKAVVMMQTEAEAKVSFLLTAQAAGTAFALITLIIILFNLRRHFAIPLASLGEYAHEVASGKLDARVKCVLRMEFKALADTIGQMIASLRSAIEQADQRSDDAEQSAQFATTALREAEAKQTKINTLIETMKDTANRASDTSRDVFAAVEELSTQVDQVNGGVEIQRDRMAETATAMEEMNSTVMEVARNASDAADSASRSRENAQTGADEVRKAVASMQQIETRMGTLKQTMDQLGSKADGIGQIINVINDIADQTNLLALNAAIEAARAGEAGRGFAVVADEVRKLAEKTMTATQEVSSAIKEIQTTATDNIAAVESTATYITESTMAATEAGQFMEEIVSFVQNTASQVESIATASEEQSAASEEINMAVSDVTRVAGETAEGMGRAAGALMEITSLVQELDSVIQIMAAGKAEAIGTRLGDGDKLLEWFDELSVRVGSIDDQHKVLIDLINELHAAMRQRKGNEVMLDVVDRLKDYTVKHFGYEEQLFDRHRYAETEEHKKAHRMFVQKVVDFEKGLKTGKATVSMDVMKFLKDWLVQHIQGVDQRYSDFMLNKGIK